MDDRVPGTMAPEPNSMASGWSLAHALEGASRRASPKASLSRHLVGYRAAANDGAAVPHPGLPFDAEAAQPSPEDAALIARAAQSGEAAWAHERVSLIARALDDEASRLAGDPQKAGKVAEHLAPLIEQAFAGADAEAPGDYARAILGRERALELLQVVGREAELPDDVGRVRAAQTVRVAEEAHARAHAPRALRHPEPLEHRDLELEPAPLAPHAALEARRRHEMQA